jgi:hypothetical protein
MIGPIPDPMELKRQAYAELREVEIRKQLDRINKLLQRCRYRAALVIQP